MEDFNFTAAIIGLLVGLLLFNVSLGIVFALIGGFFIKKET